MVFEMYRKGCNFIGVMEDELSSDTQRVCVVVFGECVGRQSASEWRHTQTATPQKLDREKCYRLGSISRRNILWLMVLPSELTLTLSLICRDPL